MSMRILLSVAVAAVLLVSPVAAQEFPLQYRGAADPLHGQLVRTATFWATMLKGKPDGITGEPSGLTKGAFYCSVRGASTSSFVMLLDPARVPGLYVDANGNGDLSDEQKISGTLASSRPGMLSGMSAAVFGPVSLPMPGGENAPVKFMVEVYDKGLVLVYPAGAMVGQVRTEERTYAVALLDANLNGRYGDVWQGKAGYDFLCVDASGNGRFESAEFLTGEVFPLPRMIQLGTTYYNVAVAQDGSSLTIEKANPAFGGIDVGDVGARLVLLSGNGSYGLSGNSGKWELPVGQYLVAYVGVNKSDGAATWTVEGYAGSKPFTFDVAEGETTKVKLGPPFKVKIDVAKYQDAVSVGLSGLEGQAGELYSVAAKKNNITVAPPKVKVIGASGETLASSGFEYG